MPPRPQAPIYLEAWEHGAWVHSVRFSWRYRTDAVWKAEALECQPWEPGSALPVALAATEGMGFAWPGALPPHQAAITWALNIEWGLSRQPFTRTYRHGEGSTNWQT